MSSPAAPTTTPASRDRARSWRTVLVAGAAGLTLVLAGCSAGAEEETAAEPDRALNVVQPGAPGEDSVVLDPTAVPSIEPPPHTEADVAFMQDMIGHHAQAVVMTSLVHERTDNEQLVLFVERMDVSQVDEISQMQTWLEERGEEVPAWDPVFGAQGGHSDMAMDTTDDSMPGMATEAQLAELEAARGEDFDRLFLTMMTTHHIGAVTMVEKLYEAGGGEEIAIQQMAGHIVSDQGIELDRMATMLAELDA